jgi:hypothetical protein
MEPVAFLVDAASAFLLDDVSRDWRAYGWSSVRLRHNNQLAALPLHVLPFTFGRQLADVTLDVDDIVGVGGNVQEAGKHILPDPGIVRYTAVDGRSGFFHLVTPSDF